MLDVISSMLVQLGICLLDKASNHKPQQTQQAAILCKQQHSSEVKALFGKLNDIFSFNCVTKFEAQERIPPYKVLTPFSFFPFATQVLRAEEEEGCPLCKAPFGPLQSGTPSVSKATGTHATVLTPCCENACRCSCLFSRVVWPFNCRFSPVDLAVEWVTPCWFVELRSLRDETDNGSSSTSIS